MAWFAAALPYIAGGVQAAGSIQSGLQNSKTLKMQAIASQQQSQADEEAQRRESRQFLGRQAAAAAEAGVGYDGSTGLIAAQSATMAELDALNTRYAGRLRGAGLLSDSRATKARGFSLAGQQLLQSIGSNYTGGGFGGARAPSPQARREAWLASPGKSMKANPMGGY